MIRAIVAADERWGIGRKNGLLFSLPEDMKFFRETTMDGVIAMGSNTLLSFPGGKPLPRRVNVVLWPGGEKRDDCIVAGSMAELVEALRPYRAGDIYIVGGAMFYRTMLPYCGEALVTRVSADGGAEVFFPDLDAADGWEKTYESAPTFTGGYEIRFTRYVNSAPKDLWAGEERK